MIKTRVLDPNIGIVDHDSDRRPTQLKITTSAVNARVAALIPVGGDEKNSARVRDLVESILYYEPQIVGILLIEDSQQRRDLLSPSWLPFGVKCAVMQNPRNGSGYGYYGGLSAGILRGLQWIHKNWSIDFVLKVDTDALVIGTFSEWLRNAEMENPSAGLFGTIGITCNRGFYSFGSERYTVSPLVEALTSDKFWHAAIQRASIPRPFRRRSELRKAQRACFNVVKPHIKMAIANGFRTHCFCQGGAYAVSARMMERMHTLGYFDTAEAWTYLPFKEDIIMGMYAYAMGFQMCDGSNTGKPFGIQWSGLAFPPSDLVAKGYRIIHSIKDQVDFSEMGIRKFFSSIRTPEHRLSKLASSIAIQKSSEQRLVFYSLRSAVDILQSCRNKVVIYAGDRVFQSFAVLSQVLSLVTFYKRSKPDCEIILIAPFEHLIADAAIQPWSIQNPAHVLLYSHVNVPADLLVTLNLEVINQLSSIDVVHCCGSGPIRSIRQKSHSVLDSLLLLFRPQRYILSGLSLSASDVEDFSEHIARFNPAIVGCRDQTSSNLLAFLPKRAIISSSDALDEFERVSQKETALDGSSNAAITFAFQASLRPWILSDAFGEAVNPDRWRNARSVLDNVLAEFAKSEVTRPLFINGSWLNRDDLSDTWSTLARTKGRFLYRSYSGLEFAAYALINHLEEAVSAIRTANVTRFAGTSYHVNLMFRCMGIASFYIPIGASKTGIVASRKDTIPDEVLRTFQKFLQTPEESLRLQIDVDLKLERRARECWVQHLMIALQD